MGLKKVNKVAIVKLINNLNYRGKKISREKDVFLLVKTIKGRRKVSGLDFLEKTMKIF
jgi:ribosomal protein S7